MRTLVAGEQRASTSLENLSDKAQIKGFECCKLTASGQGHLFQRLRVRQIGYLA